MGLLYVSDPVGLSPGGSLALWIICRSVWLYVDQWSCWSLFLGSLVLWVFVPGSLVLWVFVYGGFWSCGLCSWVLWSCGLHSWGLLVLFCASLSWGSLFLWSLFMGSYGPLVLLVLFMETSVSCGRLWVFVLGDLWSCGFLFFGVPDPVDLCSLGPLVLYVFVPEGIWYWETLVA